MDEGKSGVLMEEKPFEKIILIDKPAGMSSFGVVARVRRKLRDEQGKKVKVGHTGTLDPFATGLLIILAGKATKKSDDFLKKDKEYVATVRLGEVSTTGDIEGEIEKVSTKVPSLEEVEAVVRKLTGEIEQTVPVYSAVKINGERAYKLARKGKTVEMPTRKVTIFSLEILEYSYPELKIRTHVSSGTYIRTLGEDIGKNLGTGAYLTALRRTKIADFDVKDSLKLDDYML
jgi:tRNA pseudouridine55 synthase